MINRFLVMLNPTVDILQRLFEIKNAVIIVTSTFMLDAPQDFTASGGVQYTVMC